MEGIYIYGIIEASEEKLFDLCGFAADEKVHTIPYQDISAVVSDSEMVNYTTLVKDVVARYILTHQQVIEKIMDSHTIIPMKLGTYAFNIREVEEILSKGYTMFKDIFRNINNKIEMDVAATWSDLDSIIKEIGEGQDVKKLKEESMSRPEGVSAKDQIRIGSLIKNILDNKRERCALEIETELKDVSMDFRKHVLMDDRMIFNIAFLIDKNKKTEFERKLDELNAIFNEKLNFRSVGPLPPYSFYTFEIKKLKFEEIDWARKRLGLVNDFVTKGEIKKAHQAMAFALHPDKNPNVPGIERELDEVTKAYKALWEYCHGERCSFDEEEFKKNSILVKVKE
ncbi:MAG: GvpL/GvpF family gas vesicle protein [Nitrospinae bacterium]|nr:GvpL/GvpF family gas vesicle protein [Nitrospinota bacterium]